MSRRESGTVECPPGSSSFLTAIKSNRNSSPSPNRSPLFYINKSASISTTSILLPPPILSPPNSPPSTLSHSAHLIDYDSPRGRRTARPPTAPNPLLKSIPLSNNLSSLSERPSPKIRFAPFPEPRPRSYSTGHNLFLEAGDVTDHTTERGWIRRDPSQLSENAISDEEQDDNFPLKKLRHPTDSIFSTDRFRMEGQIVGKASTSDGFSNHSNKSQESMTMKILTFGLGGKKKKDNRPSTSDGTTQQTTGEPLSRVSSIESDVSRGSSVSGISGFSGASSNRRFEPRTWGSESGGIRRTPANTDHNSRWELQQILSKSSSSASVSSHQYAPSRRANYPPVAQRSKKKPKPAATKVADPKFVEWGFKSAGSNGGGMGNNRGISVDEDEEEEGSGLAWIKKRKEERRLKAEADEMEKVAEEVREAERVLALSMSLGPPAINLIPNSPLRESSPAFFSADLHTLTEMDELSPTRLEFITKMESSDSLNSLKVQHDSIDSTPGSITVSPVSTTPSEEQAEPDYSLPSLSTSIAPIRISKRSKSPSYRSPVVSDEEDTDLEKEDSDLDEEELAAEELLREKARGTVAAAEKYFDRSHVAHVVR